MRFYADLHLHSHYSRATSKEMNVLDLSKYAKYKGLNLLGTGDFQHPKYLEELRSKLKPTGTGLYEYDGIYYMLQTELANIYTHNGKGRKIHHLILVPDFNAADQLQKELLKWGRIDYDGRPIFGKSSQELVKTVMAIDPKCEVIPAHIWTPWFGLLGDMGGYNSLKECYEDEIKHIHALETGLSSDPAMNWRCSSLDKYSLISNSDSHSPWPWRMGREANVFDIEPSYNSLINALRTKHGFSGTIEVDPAYGKYHWDGHRACGVSMSPIDSLRHSKICPVCKKQLTIGVESRVEQLADNPIGRKPEGAVPYKSLVTLADILASFLGKGLGTKTVWTAYTQWINHFGTEFNILIDAPEEELLAFSKEVGEAIIKIRHGEFKVKPGYDGVYGSIIIDGRELSAEKDEPELKKAEPQSDLNKFF